MLAGMMKIRNVPADLLIGVDKLLAKLRFANHD
jgi:hypothetical protein